MAGLSARTRISPEDIMKAEITQTSVRMVIEFSQRELELFYALVGHITGNKGEEISGVAGSAREYTELAHALSVAARTQVRIVEANGLSPKESTAGGNL